MAYSKRYVGGFVDLPSTTTPVDSAFLNAVEAALLKLFDTDPTVDGQVPSWIAASTKYGPALLLNKNVDPSAGIVKSKLDFTGANGIVNADVAGAAAIARSKLALTGAMVQPTDFSAGSKITAGTLAVGPPAAPATNDIWIATDVDANGTCWMFRYNSAEATYKWEFIGGPPVMVHDFTAAVLNAMTQVGVTGFYYPSAITVARGGDYAVSGMVVVDPNGVAANVVTAAFVDTGLVTSSGAEVTTTATATNDETNTLPPISCPGVVAAKKIGLCTQSASVGTTKHLKTWLAVTPVRII